MRFLFATALLIRVAAAQSTEWRGPVSGILYDAPARALRPVVGVPGGAYLGAPLADGLDSAYVAPNGESALALQSGRMVLIRSLRSDAMTVTPIDNAGPTLDIVAWTPDSKIAVAFCAAGRTLQRIDIGPAIPRAETLIELAAGQGELTSVAVNSDASRVVAGIGNETGGGYYQIVDGSAAELTALTPGACVFSKAHHAFFAIARDGSRVVRFSGLAGDGWEPVPLAEPPATPLGLAVSRDAKVLFVASATESAVRAYDLATGAMASSVPLAAAPQGLAELPAASSVFVMTARLKSGDPVWLFDARSAPSAFFVPGE